MNYPCKLIQDILPLYQDEVCSEESKDIVEKHLLQCGECSDYYSKICQGDDFNNIENELQKAASFKAVKKKILHRQIVIGIISLLLFFIIAFSTILMLKKTTAIVEYKNNISVSMVNNSLMGRLYGSVENHVKIKNVEIIVNGEKKTYLFFYLSNTKWDKIITNSEAFSEYVLCPAQKGANRINSVYYYTGDYTNLEMLKYDELQKIIEKSVLLWEQG